jgi:hypothetical protein
MTRDPSDNVTFARSPWRVTYCTGAGSEGPSEDHCVPTTRASTAPIAPTPPKSLNHSRLAPVGRARDEIPDRDIRLNAASLRAALEDALLAWSLPSPAGMRASRCTSASRASATCAGPMNDAGSQYAPSASNRRVASRSPQVRVLSSAASFGVASRARYRSRRSSIRSAERESASRGEMGSCVTPNDPWPVENYLAEIKGLFPERRSGL